MVITSDVLDFSKLDANKVELERIELDVVHVVEEALSLTRPHAAAKGLRLSSGVEPARMPRYLGDPGRLRQVLLNLVSNAVKFTDAGAVEVRASIDLRGAGVDHVRFEVRDTGIGLSPEQQAVIFDAFAQAESSTTRRYGGTGLGLAICTNLVELMGGALRVSSAPGRGSTFGFTIPLAHARRDADEPGRAPDPMMVSSEASSIFARAAQLVVLLVEDDLVSRKVVTALLERLGCQVDTAADGARALQAVASQLYDVVFMDCELPGMNGFEATARIRALAEPACHTAIIAMTGHAMQQDREPCLQAGMDGYLGKPVRRRALITALRPYLRHRTAEHPSWDTLGSARNLEVRNPTASSDATARVASFTRVWRDRDASREVLLVSRSRTAPARRAKTPIHIAAGKSALQRSPSDLDSLAHHPSRSSRPAGHWLPRSHGEHERSSARDMVAARSSLAGAAPATIESVPCYTWPDFASVSIEQSAMTILPMRPAPRQPGNPAMEGRGGREPRPASRPAPGKVTRTSLLSPSRGGVDPRELAAPILEVTAAPAAGAGSAVLQLRSAETAPARAGTTSDSLSFDEAKAAILAGGASMEAIYAAIRRCTDRPRLAAGSEVQSLLRARFSGHDYWKALLLLAYGSEAAFPDAIKEIWAATAGWGADAERIYRALQALSPADVALIGAVPGLRGLCDEKYRAWGAGTRDPCRHTGGSLPGSRCDEDGDGTHAKTISVSTASFAHSP